MAHWLSAVGFWEGQMLRRIFLAWRAQGGQKLLTALAHWESSQSGLGTAFRWWRRVVVHLHEADDLAQQHRQQHACRAAFQVSHCPVPGVCSILCMSRICSLSRACLAFLRISNWEAPFSAPESVTIGILTPPHQQNCHKTSLACSLHAMLQLASLCYQAELHRPEPAA